MAVFDAGRYVMTILMIGVCAGALMWIYDQLATPFNTLVDTGMVSTIATQSSTVIYWGIVAFAPINLLFATVAAILVANARSEVNSPLIQTDYGGHMILMVVIMAALVLNLMVSGIVDPFIIALGDNAVPSALIDPDGAAANVMQLIFSATHLLCALAVGVAYLFMILKSVRIQTLEWSV
jgi:hypothetical protein